MFIGSSCTLKNKVSGNPILINNKPVPRTNKYLCLGVNMDERLSWVKHIYSICSKVGAGIGAMRRVKPFVPLSTTKLLKYTMLLYTGVKLPGECRGCETRPQAQSRPARISILFRRANFENI
jgi:hypothetical protein